MKLTTYRGKTAHSVSFLNLRSSENWRTTYSVTAARGSQHVSSCKVSSSRGKDQICDWYAHTRWLCSLCSRNQESRCISWSWRCGPSYVCRVASRPYFLSTRWGRSSFGHLLSLQFLSVFLRDQLRDLRLHRGLSCSFRICWRSFRIGSLLRVFGFQRTFVGFSVFVSRCPRPTGT